jgi:UDP-N-acetyl-D-mannosaminuronic acid dehydrogenase
MHRGAEIEIAEITTVIKNVHRFLQIAFAEELHLYCQANNINFPELPDYAKWNDGILGPREGIGEHCLPRDTRMFPESSEIIKSMILTAAIEVDKDYRNIKKTDQISLEESLRN